MTIFQLILNINVINSCLQNSVVSVVYDEIIFHVELNISVASVVSDKTNFQVILIVNAVVVVNDEIMSWKSV